MTRRLLAFAVAIAWLAGCGGRASGPSYAIPPMTNVAPARVSPDHNVNELPQEPVVRSVNGVAKVTLIADINPATGLPGFLYGGLHGISPTIRVKPGDTIDIELENQLQAIKGDADDMNLHFHGLGASPKAPGDDVLTMLAKPGQTLHYVVHVPKNQEPGLYWYHPHVHRQTNYQVGEGGMSGAIVVDGLQRHLPGLEKMKERVIVVRSTGIGQTIKPEEDVDEDGMSMGGGDAMGGSAAMGSMDTMHPFITNKHPCSSKDGLTTSLNGAVHPVITIAPHEKQFFRVVNATGHKTLNLAIDGGKFEVVAIDGFALDTYPGTPATKTVSTIVIPPAARAEFVVTGPASGHAKFRTLCYDTGPDGDADPPLVLASLKAPAHGQDGGSFDQRPLTVGAPLPQNVYTEPLPPVAAKRLVVFSEGAKHFYINGKAFSMRSPPMFVVHVGTVEEWTVRNDTQEIHDFHIHQTHFVVESVNGKKLTHPFWADSFVVPHRASDGTPGTAKLLMDFRDPIIRGEFLFHCHILDHEDSGMMAKIQAI
ncbi:MAG: multicopper oxidase family protein [Candidatus Baltobacteraceae bacterium]